MAIPNLESWNLVRLHGTWRKHDGTLYAGTATVIVPVRLVTAADDSIIPAGVFYSAPLNTVDGAPSLDIMVPSTDDPDVTAAEAWELTVVIELEGAEHETFVLPVPVSTGVEGINLRTITPRQ